MEHIRVETKEFRQYCAERVITTLLAVELEGGQYSLTGLNRERSQSFVVVDVTEGKEKAWRNLGYLRNFVAKTGALSFIIRLRVEPELPAIVS